MTTNLSARTLSILEPAGIVASNEPLRLRPHAVHVWAFMLAGTPEWVEQCRGLLCEEERHRAARFVFERDRVRYTIAHAVMRHLLGRYCNLSPAALEFRAGAAGKPELVSSCNPGTVRFNLTHSEDCALLGVTTQRELGIDLEKYRSNIEALAISQSYFFGAERDAIVGATPEERHQTFLRYWVAKEAVLKAQGIGLGFPLDRFRVEFLPDQRTARIESLDPARLAPFWTVRMLPCAPGWLGAVASSGMDWHVELEDQALPSR